MIYNSYNCSTPSKYPIQSTSNKTSRFPPVVLSVDIYGDPSSAPSYVPSVSPSRAPSEQQVGALREERRNKLEQVKALGYIIASGESMLDEADQLYELYIIKFERGVYMLETNEKTFQRKIKIT